MAAAVALLEGVMTEGAGGEDTTRAATAAVRAMFLGVVGATGEGFHGGDSGALKGEVAMEDGVGIHEGEATPEVAVAIHVVVDIRVEVATREVVATPEDSPVAVTAAPATTTATLTSMKNHMTSQLRTATLATPLVTSTSRTIQMTSMTSM